MKTHCSGNSATREKFSSLPPVDRVTLGSFVGVDLFSVGMGDVPRSGDNWVEVNVGVGDYLGVTFGKNNSVRDYFGQPGSYIKVNVGVGIGTPISAAGSNLRKK